MRRSHSIQQAFTELKQHQLPRGAVAYDELHTSAVHALVWLSQYRHLEPATSVTERRIFEREVSTLEELRDELLRWSSPSGPGASRSGASSTSA